MPDLERLLTRIGLAAPPAPDAAGLAQVHRAYVAAMPYETIAIALDRQASLDLEAVADRVLEHGRGGYCFELNGLLAWVLEELGFRVERREGRAGAREEDGPTNHLALVVSLPDGSPERWLADAGLGEGALDPIPLQVGAHLSPGGLRWTLEHEGEGWWLTNHAWGSFAGVSFSDHDVDLTAFLPHHERLSYDPDSPFVRAFIVQRPADDRITTLRARTLSVRGPRVEEDQVLPSPEALAATLLGSFGVALSEEDLAALWRRVCVQHDDWVAGQARNAR